MLATIRREKAQREFKRETQCSNDLSHMITKANRCLFDDATKVGHMRSERMISVVGLLSAVTTLVC
jgi:hypothetical protein